ncbi:MAG TPA: trypsin-like serine protease, partial [Micromonosporaceae bacterium]|nr:trypsin-like serine protease [Micromonosporaceae bacterium]
MITKLRRAGLSAAAVTALTLAFSATPAGAVIDGTDDTANRYANVGALQLQTDDGWFTFCSGTLVAENVVLTAAHCTDFFTGDVGDPDELGIDDLQVTFDPQPDEDSTAYGVAEIVIHPGWFEQPGGRGNSKHLYLAPPAQDIALIFLDEDVSGIIPAPVADAGYLDTLDLTSETFTVVGYGTDGFVKGSLMSP